MTAAKTLAQVETAPRSAVEALWQEKLPHIPLPPLNLRTLRKALAFEVQSKAAPALSAQAKQVLKAHEPRYEPRHEAGQAARRLRTEGVSKPLGMRSVALAPGAVLVREWNGRRYQVTVGHGAYELEGREYKSLTQIAKAITGTHWSGPRFFGLAKAPSKKRLVGA